MRASTLTTTIVVYCGVPLLRELDMASWNGKDLKLALDVVTLKSSSKIGLCVGVGGQYYSYSISPTVIIAPSTGNTCTMSHHDKACLADK